MGELKDNEIEDILMMNDDTIVDEFVDDKESDKKSVFATIRIEQQGSVTDSYSSKDYNMDNKEDEHLKTNSNNASANEDTSTNVSIEKTNNNESIKDASNKKDNDNDDSNANNNTI